MLPYKSAIHPKQISLQQACEERVLRERKTKGMVGEGGLVHLKQKESHHVRQECEGENG